MKVKVEVAKEVVLKEAVRSGGVMARPVKLPAFG